MEARQTPAVIRRQDYTPFGWIIDQTALDVQLFADKAVIAVTLDIRPNRDAGSADKLLLNGEHQELVSVQVDGVLLEPSRYQLEDGMLVISGLSEGHRVTVTSSHNPYENTALEGLYASGGMLCTQCEPEGFRRICFYPDRPDVMSVFSVRIEADIAWPNLLSNGNLVEKGTAGKGRHFALWHDPHKKPAYLFALVAGDLECVADSFTTASGRHVDLHIYVEKGNANLTRHAMDSLKRSMKWDEDVYGLEYDLDLFQIVAVSHFNMGAMENKGLNIFNSKFVLADALTATDDDLMRVEAIIAHEYFHNWTGNRVTCRDWFQLTLKEGLTVFRDQCFTADMHDAAVKRAEDVATLRAIQFTEDASPTAHPIRPESYSEINNFYTPTVYEKGAEVIRMMYARLGVTGFRAGMDLYFARHDGQAVTCDDFIAAMADANKVDLSSFSLWYRQAGTPQLSAKRLQCDGQHLTLELSQKLAPTAAGTPTDAMPIPVRLGFVAGDGRCLAHSIDSSAPAEEHIVLLEGDKQLVEIRFADGQSAAEAVPSLCVAFLRLYVFMMTSPPKSWGCWPPMMQTALTAMKRARGWVIMCCARALTARKITRVRQPLSMLCAWCWPIKPGAMISKLFAFLSPARQIPNNAQNRQTRQKSLPKEWIYKRGWARPCKKISALLSRIWRIWKMQPGAACKTACWRWPVPAVMKQPLILPCSNLKI